MILVVVLGLATGTPAAVIYVTDTQQAFSTRGCSLQEAIYSANFHNNVAVTSVNPDGSDYLITTNCVSGDGNDIIILPSATQPVVIPLSFPMPDPHIRSGRLLLQS
jgi:hypothetical protein